MVGHQKIQELKPDLVLLDLAIPTSTASRSRDMMTGLDPPCRSFLFTVMNLRALRTRLAEQGVYAVVSKAQSWISSEHRNRSRDNRTIDSVNTSGFTFRKSIGLQSAQNATRSCFSCVETVSC